ncbi:MAG: histidine kinase [Eubacterium sp.]|nr:histidine kinase [Eubacterium sp.]
MRRTEFKETEMKSKKRYRKLLLQLMAIIFPLFILMTVAIVWTVYNSALNGFLEAQNSHMEELLSDPENHFEFMNEKYYGEDIREWYIEQLEKGTVRDYSEELSEEELLLVLEYETRKDSFEYDWYVDMPEDIRDIYMKQYLYNTSNHISDIIKTGNIDSLFLMDLTGDSAGTVLFDCNTDGTGRKPGEAFDLDLSEHPALRELLDHGRGEIVFERTADFPTAGNYYIGYKPVVIGGKVRAVIGVSYRWDMFRDSLAGTIRKALIICIGGIAMILVVLLIFLYRNAVSPAAKMQKAVLEYTGDKDSSKIVGKMYRIRVKNELGYLSDAIADLALEIDHYMRENIRIAGERERAEKERFEAEVQVMVSQIRPHFVYNTLSSIAILCDIDPKTAKEAAITFAKYLRANMDALKQKAPVPFEIELEHLKNYLYIEKLRFADALNVEYDIQTTDFELPILSIQPLVENAVKHGVGMKKYGGTVKIVTKETDTAYEVVVSDDGVGFDPEEARIRQETKSDGKSHVGMENTKKRLKEMCGADIVIESRIGEGTTARVIIPKDIAGDKPEGTAGDKPKAGSAENTMNGPDGERGE